MKNRSVAILLALFLGGIGIQKFYLNKPGQGVLCVLFCWTFIPAIIALIDVIRFLAMGEDKFQKLYSPMTQTQQEK
ncbi:MAG: TM2 domain-containing protein [Candidatus Paceibacterota bacterium]|jgi:TM2 domain-containing membrane protein YozV